MSTNYIRRQFAGGAVKTTLSGGIGSTATSIGITASTGWPDGSVGPFIICINRGNANEEKVLVTSRSGTTLTTALAQRGYDSTTGAAHVAGETVEVTGSAQDGDEANQAVVATLGAVTTKGDLLVGTGANTLGKLGVGANNTLLVSDNTQPTGLRWGAAPVGTISSITSTGSTITVGSPSGPTTNVDLANVGPGATGPIGDSTHVAAVTINAKGQVTALTSVALTASGATTQLARSVLGSNGTFSFSSISGSYNKLVLEGVIRSAIAAATDSMVVRLNGDSGASQYFTALLLGNGSTSSSGNGNTTDVTSGSTPTVVGNTSTAGHVTMFRLEIPEYAATTFFKAGTLKLRTAITGDFQVEEMAFSYKSTSAITSITVTASGGGNFITGSTLTLYGVA